MSKCKYAVTGTTAGFAFCMSCLFIPNAWGQQPEDIVITTHHINSVRDARTPWDEAQNCPARRRLCSGGQRNCGTNRSSGKCYPARQCGRCVYGETGRRGNALLYSRARWPKDLPRPGRRRWEFTHGPRAKDWARAEAGTTAWSLSLTSRQGSRMITPSPENAACKPAAYECRGASGVNHGLAACGSKDL